MSLFRISLVLFAQLVCAQAQEASPLILDKTIPLDKVEGRIDHMAADIAGQRLFVAALGNNTVEVVDLKSGKKVLSLPGFAEPQGIAYVPDLDRIVVASGQDGLCKILDGQSFKIVKSLDCGDDADNVRYEENAKRIYVGYGSGFLGVFDVKTGAKLAAINLAGHPESFRLTTHGSKIFVNVPRAEHIAVVDREKKGVVATWPLKAAKANYPMSLDEANHRLFTGCRNPARLLVYDYLTGQLVTSLPISRDTDDLCFDSANKLIFVSCGEGNIEIIRQTDANHYTTQKSIATAPGARTSLLVPELKIFCLAVPHRGSQPAEIRVYKTN